MATIPKASVIIFPPKASQAPIAKGNKKVAVIGGGPAGLASASFLSRAGADVTVFEKNARPARKVMITGKGRCNVTNDTDVNGLVNAVTGNGRFLYSAFSNFTSEDTKNFFEKGLTNACSCGIISKSSEPRQLGGTMLI